MKKFLGILVLISILFTSIFAVNSFAEENAIVIDTPAFSLELPEGFKKSGHAGEEKGVYRNIKSDISLLYEFTTNSYHDDVKECMRDSRYNYKYSNLDFSHTTQLIEIGGKNFLKDVVVKRKGLKQVLYLTTTAEYITYIEFYGSEDMDEDAIEKIISNIEIKGTTAKSYKTKMNILIYGGIAIIFIILPITFRIISKKKKEEKERE